MMQESPSRYNFINNHANCSLNCSLLIYFGFKDQFCSRGKVKLFSMCFYIKHLLNWCFIAVHAVFMDLLHCLLVTCIHKQVTCWCRRLDCTTFHSCTMCRHTCTLTLYTYSKGQLYVCGDNGQMQLIHAQRDKNLLVCSLQLYNIQYNNISYFSLKPGLF